MIIQITDGDSIILANLIWDNYQKGQHKTVDLCIGLENGHLYIVLNEGGKLKLKSYNPKGKLIKKARETALKRKAREYEGICIDLNLEKNPNKKKS